MSRAIVCAFVLGCGTSSGSDGGPLADAAGDAPADAVTDAPLDSGIDRCNRPNKCPNDPADTHAQIADCRKRFQDCMVDPSCAKCIDASNAYTDCAYAHIVCGTDGKTDYPATATSVSAECKAEYSANQACFSDM